MLYNKYMSAIGPTELEMTARPEIHLSTENKIFGSLDRLKEEVDRLKMEGKKIGYVTGTFDVKHLGHDAFLDFARSQCDILVVAVASDDFAKKNKDKVYFSQEARAQMLSASSFVDLVFKFGGPNAEADSPEWNAYLNEIGTKLNPDVIIASSATDPSFEVKKAEAELLGKKFVDYKAPAYDSSTKIKAWSDAIQ